MAHQHKGPFFMFMVETRRRLEARGERFPNGYEDIVGIAGDKWAKMTTEEKDCYREKSAEFKHSRNFMNQKVAARANKAKRRERGAGDEYAGKEKQEEYTEEAVELYPTDDENSSELFDRKRSTDRNHLEQHLFWNTYGETSAMNKFPMYVISAVFHARSASYDYFPAEIAVVEFTLGGGISKEKCFVLSPIDIPNRLKDRAIAMRDIHKIPFDEVVPGTTGDLESVMRELANFRRLSDKYKFFCVSKEFNAVQGCLHYLKRQTRNNCISTDDIFCMEDLATVLYKLRGKEATENELFGFSECNVTNSEMFSHWKELNCDFHKEHGTETCAMVTAKRACYHLFQVTAVCCQFQITSNHRAAVTTTAKMSKVYRPILSRNKQAAGTQANTGQGGSAVPGGSRTGDTLQSQVRRAQAVDDVRPAAMPNRASGAIPRDPRQPAAGAEAGNQSQTQNENGGNATNLTSSVRSENVTYPPSHIKWNDNADLRRKLYGSKNMTLPVDLGGIVAAEATTPTNQGTMGLPAAGAGPCTPAACAASFGAFLSARNNSQKQTSAVSNEASSGGQRQEQEIRHVPRSAAARMQALYGNSAAGAKAGNQSQTQNENNGNATSLTAENVVNPPSHINCNDNAARKVFESKNIPLPVNLGGRTAAETTTNQGTVGLSAAGAGPCSPAAYAASFGTFVSVQNNSQERTSAVSNEASSGGQRQEQEIRHVPRSAAARMQALYGHSAAGAEAGNQSQTKNENSGNATSRAASVRAENVVNPPLHINCNDNATRKVSESKNIPLPVNLGAGPCTPAACAASSGAFVSVQNNSQERVSAVSNEASSGGQRQGQEIRRVPRSAAVRMQALYGKPAAAKKTLRDEEK